MHPEMPDGLYTVMDKQAMGLMFAQIRDAANRLMDEKYDKGDIRRAWITTWAHETGHAVVAEHFGLPLQRAVLLCSSRWLQHHDVYL